VVESATIVESAQTAVESQDLTSVVDAPFPQDANTTIANNATICFIIVCFCFIYKLFLIVSLLI